MLKRFLCILLLVLSLLGCTQLDAPPKQDLTPNDGHSTQAPSPHPDDGKADCGTLTIHFLDVGQGDCIFIELPEKRCMLIDAGNKGNGDDIVDYIQKSGYAKIDYLIATHPHADHIGGMQKVVEAFDIQNIYMPRVSANTQVFENLLLAVQKKGLKITAAKSGVSVLEEDTLSAVFLSPAKDSYADLNHYSAILKLTHGENVCLFTGDAETVNEAALTGDLSAKVVKVGHHGSDTSSSQRFIQSTSPEYAVISVGEGNRYDHPSDKIVSAWKNIGATVFRTDQNGTVIIQSDGKDLVATTEK